jgi:virginiamycin B lyase
MTWPLPPSGPPSSFTGAQVPTAGSYPSGITTGPDGNLWFTESYGW